jgi:hypothetical protein
MTVAEVVRAVNYLSDVEKAELAYTLYHTNAISIVPMSRAQALAEVNTIASHTLTGSSLFGAFGPPNIEPSDDEIDSYFTTLSKAWEEEMNELSD